MKKIIIIFIALMTTIQSCSKKNITVSNSKVNTVSEIKRVEKVEFKKWYVTKMEAKNVSAKNAYVELDFAELNFNGKSFCNSVFGKIVTDKVSKIEFTNLGMTMMACEDMSQEQTFTSLLRKTKFYKMSDTQLLLFDENNKPILSFSSSMPDGKEKENEGKYHHDKSPINRLYDIWGLKTLYEKVVDKSKGLMLEMKTTDMTFMGYASCNKIFGSIAGGKEGELNFLSIGATRKLCPDMTSEREFIKALKSVKRYELKNLRLLMFDENGKQVLDFIKMD